jgi:phage anti-repressor protein
MEMSQMPAIIANDDGRRLVNGRELHEWLEIKSRYNDWIKRMIEYGFEENLDFEVVTQKRVTTNLGNPITEFTNHALTPQMAAEIAMMQRTEKGKLARVHYIYLEQRFVSSLGAIVAKQAVEINALKSGQMQLSQSVHAVEVKQSLINEDYYTLLGWYALHKKKFDLDPNVAKMAGKALSKASRKADVPILKKFDSKYGNVNQYHKTVLVSLFDF